MISQKILKLHVCIGQTEFVLITKLFIYCCYLYSLHLIHLRKIHFIFILLYPHFFKVGAIWDLPCPFVILWFCHSVSDKT